MVRVNSIPFEYRVFSKRDKEVFGTNEGQQDK